MISMIVENVYDLMRIFYNERVIKVLESILSKEEYWTVKSSYPKSTFYNIIRVLRKVEFIKEDVDSYHITTAGLVYLKVFKMFSECVETISKILRHFPDHKVVFPDEFLLRLHEIKDFEVVTSSRLDILKPIKTYVEYIKESKEIYGVSPILFSDYSEIFKDLLGKNTVALVLTEDVAEQIVDKTLERYKPKLEIYVIDFNPYIAFTVTDRFLSIGFFYESGNYDFTRELISTSPSALKFGKDLFEYYRAKAKRIL
jgi:predicted transcriptional regulator